jgi:SAM-dependent methyltransferase
MNPAQNNQPPTSPTPPAHFVVIDEEGYFSIDGVRMSDASICRAWLEQLQPDKGGHFVGEINGKPVMYEPFDEPYVALSIERSGADWLITMPYGVKAKLLLETLTVDEWDRFHGRTERSIPFVLSRAAQAQFFNLVDEYDDDGVVIDGHHHETKPWLQENPDANRPTWWTEMYNSESARWELNAPSHALPTLVPKLKLQRSRILIAGAGSGNDAAWFAQQGHLVTAVDFSEEAIARAKSKYGNVENLKFQQADVFALPDSFTNSFDMVFEHTLYCAINPARRNDLVKVWRRVLTDQGHLMGVFFAFDKPYGPPFGGSEWEIRARLGKGFRPLYWTRLRDSMPGRLGQEVFIYAQKINQF